MNDKPAANKIVHLAGFVPETRPASQAVRVERLWGSVTPWHNTLQAQGRSQEFLCGLSGLGVGCGFSAIRVNL